MAAKTAEELAAHAAINNHQAPHGDDDAMEAEGDSLALTQGENGQSYADAVRRTKKLEIHLARVDKSNDWYVSYEEIAMLAFKRLLLPEGKLYAVDNTPFRKIVLEIDEDVDLGELNLTQALEIRKGLKTKPLQSPDTDREVRITRAPMNMDNAEISKVVALFGEITQGVSHVVLESNGAEDGSWRVLMRGVKTAERKLRMKIRTNIPSYIMVLGQKLKIDYSGQPKTCQRCHKYWSTCPGSGKADKCKKAGGEEKDFKVVFKQLVNRIKKKGGVTDTETSAPLVAKFIPNPDQISFSGLPDDMSMDGFVEWLDANDINFLASMCFKGGKPGTFTISAYEDDCGDLVELDSGEAQNIVSKLHGTEVNKRRVIVQMEQLTTPTKKKKSKSPSTSPEVVEVSPDDQQNQQNPPQGGGEVVDKKAAKAAAKKERRAAARAAKAAEAAKGEGGEKEKEKGGAAAEAGQSGKSNGGEKDGGQGQNSEDKSPEGNLKIVISTQETAGGSRKHKVLPRGVKRVTDFSDPDSSLSSVEASPTLPARGKTTPKSSSPSNSSKKTGSGSRKGKKPESKKARQHKNF